MEAFLRPMVSTDVKEGKRFYLLGDFNQIYKGRIERVLRPEALYKAFCAEDGCRYGLDRCYVKIKQGEEQG